MSDHPLHGGCSCGRNTYIIRIPRNAPEKPRVYFDNGNDYHRAQATPLSAFLKVPLSWYRSSTHAFMQDESRSSIRRTYYEQDSLRHFCGFCGTPLSFWSEAKPADASYISLTLGSLAGSDLQDLEELGLLPKEALEDAENDKEKIEAAAPSPSNRAGGQGLPWFETMVKGSRPGNMQRSWGETRSQNGRYKVEWEIVEWTAADDVEDTARPSKRNIGVVDED